MPVVDSPIASPHSVARSQPDLSPSLIAAARFFMFSLVLLGLAVTITVDVFVGILMLCGGVMGWRGFSAGFIKGAWVVIGIGSTYAWAVPAGKLMTAMLRSWIDWPFVPTRHLAVFLAAISILMLGHLLGVFFAWWYRRHHGAAGRRSRS